MHGKGTFSWKNGHKYKGKFLDNKKHGYGIYTFKDGTT